MADQWFNSYTKIRAFAKALYQAKVLESVDEVFDYLGRPQDYDEAFQYWEELGSPGPRDKEWDTWRNSLEVTVDEE